VPATSASPAQPPARLATTVAPERGARERAYRSRGDAARASQGRARRHGFCRRGSLFERGDYPSAARRLAELSRAHPDDGRAEDSAFLGIIALQRTGKTAEAAAAAQRYLQAYPSGYRRAEAAKIAAKRCPRGRSRGFPAGSISGRCACLQRPRGRRTVRFHAKRGAA
jgi:hypothetical protein